MPAARPTRRVSRPVTTVGEPLHLPADPVGDSLVVKDDVAPDDNVVAADAAPSPPTVVPPADGTAESWRRLGRLLRPRLSSGNLWAALLTLVLGVAVVAQVRATDTGDLADLRETDLVALLDDVSGRSDDLEAEISQLEADRRRLQGDSGDAAAQEAAQERLDAYQVLAGTVPVQGPGLQLVVTDPEGSLTPSMMVDLIQELRDAGAEAIQIGQVRVVASSWVGSTPAGLMVDGVVVPTPYQVNAIGDSHTLAGAMAIPGGFNDAVRGIGGEVTAVESPTLRVTALHVPSAPRYARAVPSADDE